ncbi:hypothetical protein HDV00_010055 [Rhizophlyctis rosea]|nr:hypothetical protein HDV00_010055 [Rhizophlyctis rosea]
MDAIPDDLPLVLLLLVVPSVRDVCGALEDAVQRARTVGVCRRQWGVLTGEMEKIVRVMEGWTMWPESVARHTVNGLHRNAKDVAVYLEKLSCTTVVEEFLAFNQTSNRIAEFTRQFHDIASALDVLSPFGDSGVETEDDNLAARQEDLQHLNARLQPLIAYPKRIYGMVEGGERELLEVLDALKRKEECEGKEGEREMNIVQTEFLSVAIRTLSQAISSPHSLHRRVSKLTHNSWDIMTCNLEYGTLIGEGALSRVYASVLSGRAVAIKQFKQPHRAEGFPLELLSEHLVKWKAVKFPFLVPLVGASLKGRMGVVVMPLMVGNARDYVTKHLTSTIPILHEVAQSLLFLHRHNIIHGSLKSHNVLIDASGHIKLTDWGLTSIRAKSPSIEQLWKLDRLKWDPPEWLGDGSLAATPSTATDIYAFGTLCWELLSVGGEEDKPFGDLDGDVMVVEMIRRGKRPSRPSRCSDAMWDLMQACWDGRPGFRPSMEEILEGLAVCAGLVEGRRGSVVDDEGYGSCEGSVGGEDDGGDVVGRSGVKLVAHPDTFGSEGVPWTVWRINPRAGGGDEREEVVSYKREYTVPTYFPDRHFAHTLQTLLHKFSTTRFSSAHSHTHKASTPLTRAIKRVERKREFFQGWEQFYRAAHAEGWIVQTRWIKSGCEWSCQLSKAGWWVRVVAKRSRKDVWADGWENFSHPEGEDVVGCPQILVGRSEERWEV